MKAVAVHAIFLIAVTVIFLFFAMAIFFGWIKITEKIANPMICNSKLLSYCSEWSKTDYQKAPYDWSKEAPGCSKKGFTPSIEKCKDLLSQK